jgi:hypothetical protein
MTHRPATHTTTKHNPNRPLLCRPTAVTAATAAAAAACNEVPPCFVQVDALGSLTAPFFCKVPPPPFPVTMLVPFGALVFLLLHNPKRFSPLASAGTCERHLPRLLGLLQGLCTAFQS